MNRTKRIENILNKQFPKMNTIIVDNSKDHVGHNNFTGNNETHILIEIKNFSNLSMSRLEIHKKINYLLKKEFSTGLHSLEIKII